MFFSYTPPKIKIALNKKGTHIHIIIPQIFVRFTEILRNHSMYLSPNRVAAVPLSLL